jgi:hypothetical protein
MQLITTMAVLAFFTVRSGGDSRRPRSKRNKIKWSSIRGRNYLAFLTTVPLLLLTAKFGTDPVQTLDNIQEKKNPFRSSLIPAPNIHAKLLQE